LHTSGTLDGSLQFSETDRTFLIADFEGLMVWGDGERSGITLAKDIPVRIKQTKTT
jgi:hypothetical protein